MKGKEVDKNTVYDALKGWKGLINSKQSGDVWSEIPALPGIKFLNLRILSVDLPQESFDKANNRVSFTITYDVAKK